MPHDLTIFVPSKERPANAARLYNSFLATRKDDSELVFVLDDDDSTVDRYYWELRHGHARVITVPRGRRGMVDVINRGFEQVELGYATGFLGDDVVCRTPAWDSLMVANLRKIGPVGLVYGDDGLQGKRMATHPIMTSTLPQTLGYMALPGLQHLCVDVVWMVIAERLGVLQYLPEVSLEHMHPVNRKAKWDDQYQYLNSLEVQGHDGPVHLDYLASSQFQDDLKKLRAVADGP